MLLLEYYKKCNLCKTFLIDDYFHTDNSHLDGCFSVCKKCRKLNRKYDSSKENQRRHKKGIYKRYRNEMGFSYTKEYRKLQRQKRRALLKGDSNFSFKTIQMVYEDNIKQFGTLTCYLCFKSIPFGEDNLEHKIPLSRQGTSEYNNLAIACRQCNNKKHTKTEEEFISQK